MLPSCVKCFVSLTLTGLMLTIINCVVTRYFLPINTPDTSRAMPSQVSPPRRCVKVVTQRLMCGCACLWPLGPKSSQEMIFSHFSNLFSNHNVVWPQSTTSRRVWHNVKHPECYLSVLLSSCRLRVRCCLASSRHVVGLKIDVWPFVMDL